MRGQSCFSFCDLVLQSSLSVGNNIGGYGGEAVGRLSDREIREADNLPTIY
jgi:hypothetical protein